MCETVKVNGIDYAPVNKDAESIRIVVLQRGWVIVGRYSRNGDDCTVRNAAIVRIWGTTKGLPEIANGGPIAGKTILDKCDNAIEFHRLTEVATLICNSCKWESSL